jgi:hypothetical protein
MRRSRKDGLSTAGNCGGSTWMPGSSPGMTLNMRRLN